MLEILQNIITGICYRPDGEPFGRQEPGLGIGTQETVRWRLFTATPENAHVSTWTPCTDFADGTFAARCSGDADFTGSRLLTLKTGLPAGDVTAIDLLTELDFADIPDSGELEFTDSAGAVIRLAYTARTRIDDGFRFAVETVLTAAVPAGTAVEVPDALFFTAPHDETASTPETGVFEFPLRIDSPKLRRAASAASGERLKVTLEILIYRIDGQETIETRRLFCRSAVVNFGILGRLPGAAPLPEQINELLVYLRQIAPQYLPGIGDNGNWFIGSDDTGVPAGGVPAMREDGGARLVGDPDGLAWVYGEDNTTAAASILMEDGVLYTAAINGATAIDFTEGATSGAYDLNFGLRITRGDDTGTLTLTRNGDAVWWSDNATPPHFSADNTPPDTSVVNRVYMIRLHWDATGGRLLANLAYTEDI